MNASSLTSKTNFPLLAVVRSHTPRPEGDFLLEGKMKTIKYYIMTGSGWRKVKKEKYDEIVKTGCYFETTDFDGDKFADTEDVN